MACAKSVIRVGGVPEHFNSPWHLAMESGAFAEAGIEVEWSTIDTGTGTMCRALNQDQLDVAVALTEGVVADILKGGQHRLLGVYVSSSLQWGVHVPAGSEFDSIESLTDATFGISRNGSGSHLMAQVQADTLGWSGVKTKVVGNLDGARAALSKGEADVFMWEKITTKVHVDSGEWRRLGCFETPWPCFVVTASERALEAHGERLAQMLQIVLDTAARFKNDGDASIQYAANKYNLALDDATDWFKSVSWNSTPSISRETLDIVTKALESGGIVSAQELESLGSDKGLVSRFTTILHTV